MFEKKKPTLVEEPLKFQPSSDTLQKAMAVAPSIEGVNPPKIVQETVAAEPRPADMPVVVPPITLADLMMELSIIGEIFAKRRVFFTVVLQLQNSHFNLSCEWKDDAAQVHRYIGRNISDSLTPKGLAMVIGELKAGVGM